MSVREIVGELARFRVVEDMVQNIARSPLTPDLKDLCQMVYLIVLEYDGDKIVDLWEHGQIRFFLARVIMNQCRSRNSPYYKQVMKFRDRSQSLGDDREAGKEIQGDTWGL